MQHLLHTTLIALFFAFLEHCCATSKHSNSTHPELNRVYKNLRRNFFVVLTPHHQFCFSVNYLCGLFKFVDKQKQRFQMVVLFWKRTRKKMNKIKKPQSLCYFFSYQTLYVIVRCFKRCLAIQHFRNYSSVCVSLEMGDEKWGLL